MIGSMKVKGSINFATLQGYVIFETLCSSVGSAQEGSVQELKAKGPGFESQSDLFFFLFYYFLLLSTMRQ